MRCWGVGLSLLVFGTMGVGAVQKASAERGRAALLGQAFTPPVLTEREYDNLWKAWGLKEKPVDFDRQLRDRYGLFGAPYPNSGLPMGLRPGRGLFGKGITTDCLQCHASTIAGQTVIGLGNASFDLQAFFDDVAAVQGRKLTFPIPLSHVRGTSESVATAGLLFQFRDDDLKIRGEPAKVKLPPYTCEDVPAWWLLKKKKTMYFTGSISTHAVRPLMAFMLTPLNSGPTIKAQEDTFRAIKAYLLTLEPPKYPFAIDAKKAAAGRVVFEQTCARCHGTYGPGGSYPNKIIDLDVIGTDRSLAEAVGAEDEARFNRTWFGQEKGPDGKRLQSHAHRGYQAPPLDGVWATAPYFHNGSVPTVCHVLNSKTRPKIFTRSYRTGKEDYDPVKLGWKVTVLPGGGDRGATAIERRKVYDTTQPGRANSGHPFGDKLTEEQRMDVIEYLKTL